MFTKLFWKDAFERAVKTFAQAAVAVLTARTIGLFEVDWVNLASVAGMAALVSVLMSIASAGVGVKGTASMMGKPKPREYAVVGATDVADLYPAGVGESTIADVSGMEQVEPDFKYGSDAK